VLVDIHWARRVQAPMPKNSGPNSQENHIIETCKEGGCDVSTQETAARRKWEMEQLTRLSAPWTESRFHQPIANQLAGGNHRYANHLKTAVLLQRGEETAIARCREYFRRRLSAAVWSSHSQLTVNLNRCIFRRYYGYGEHDFLTSM
jgi:hypothetical protein